MEHKELKTGTTTVGIVCKGGIVLAADRRATSGFLIAHKKADKIHKLTENVAVTIAGTVSDAQLLIRYSQSELRLKKIRTGEDVTVKDAANLVARLVYSNIRKFSTIPGIAHFLLGGYDKTGLYLYDLYPDGSIEMCDDYISSGSGSVMAYGVLETLYKKDMSIEEGITLAAKCINAAIQRDAASGEGFQVITVTSEGVKTVVDKELRVKAEA
ncbi:MAG: proteasome subunit beta [Candidatus Woesearchaeota archaeon]